MIFQLIVRAQHEDGVPAEADLSAPYSGPGVYWISPCWKVRLCGPSEECEGELRALRADPFYWRLVGQEAPTASASEPARPEIANEHREPRQVRRVMNA